MPQRLGRDGSPLEDTGDVHLDDHDWDGPLMGYLGDDEEDGRPRFCYICRPHLRPVARVRRSVDLRFAAR